MTNLMGACAVLLATETSALAAPVTPPNAATGAAATATGLPAKRSAHAFLQLEVKPGKVWVGQSIPVTLRAYFRGAEGVALEGTPQLTSGGVFTSELAKSPRQATEIIGGQPTLVATWTGTVTPSSPEPLVLTAELPVRVTYRDAPPRLQVDDPVDPFDALAANPFDMSAVNRFFSQTMRGQLGRAREEVVSLRTDAHAIEVSALPTAGQPPTFNGAIGSFDLTTSIASPRAKLSEPITLRMTVEGDGDLDRVELSGVETSATWKAYPPKSTVTPAAKGRRARKVFEQVLVPLEGGARAIPGVALTTFDPKSGQYVTREAAPLPITIDGVAAPADVARTASETARAASAPLPAVDASLRSPPAAIAAKTILLSILPAFALVAAVWLWSYLRRRRAESSLRRTMRASAARGDVVPFYRAAHTLIETELSTRWGVPPEAVRPSLLRERLGAASDPLADVFAADEALRFGRAKLEDADLVPLCSSVERSLGGVS